MKKGKKSGWTDAADDSAKLWVTHQYFLARKAAVDPKFRAMLKTDPAAAARAIGIGVPKGSKVTVVESTAKNLVLVLPPAPGSITFPGVEISEETLKATGDYETFAFKDDFDIHRAKDPKRGNADGSQDPKQRDSDTAGDAGGKD